MVMEETALIVLLVKMLLKVFSTESVVKIVETIGILGSQRLFATVCGRICLPQGDDSSLTPIESPLAATTVNQVSCEWFEAGLSFGDPRQTHDETL
jgi:hypothetical protein